MGNFLVSFLSLVCGPTLDFVNLSLTLTGNKKRERRLWSLPSSNIMESVSLGFGRKRCWWRHDGVMPSCLQWLFRWSPPNLNTDWSWREPTIRPVSRQPWETQIAFWKKTNKHQPLNAFTPKVISVTHKGCRTPEKHKTSQQPFDLTPSMERFNQLTMKSLHFTYAGLCIKWLWSGWHFTASEIKDWSKYQIQPGWFWGFSPACSSPSP